MGNNIVSIKDLDSIIKYCKKMNAARRHILARFIDIKNYYSGIELKDWSGYARLDFHRQLFGEDDVGGIMGDMGQSAMGQPVKGFCGQLCDIVYQLEEYVCKVMATQGVSITYEEFSNGEDSNGFDGYKPENDKLGITYQMVNDAAMRKDIAFNILDMDEIYNTFKNLIECGQGNSSMNIEDEINAFEEAWKSCLNEGFNSVDTIISGPLGDNINGLRSRVSAFCGEVKGLIDTMRSRFEEVYNADKTFQEGAEVLKELNIKIANIPEIF